MAEFAQFDNTFWENYKRKNYTKIIDDIPKLLQFTCGADNVDNVKYAELCVFSLIVMKYNKTINDELLKNVCDKFVCLIKVIKNPIQAMQQFICFEYACELSNFSQAVNGRFIGSFANEVLHTITTAKRSWVDADRTTLNRFIIVVVKLESQLSLGNEWKPKFAKAKAAIKFFSSLVDDDRKSAYTEYLCGLLEAFVLYNDENADSVNELLQKVKCLVKTKSKIIKDIAIMMSQIIRAGTLLISKGSLQFKQQMFLILNELYELVRSKSLPACQYIVHQTYNIVCCDRLNTHIGLHILETVRIVFVEALNSKNINETLVSVMSNFATAETEIIAQFNCKSRDALQYNLSETMRVVAENIGVIVTACGLERAKRTLLKFLATKSLQPTVYWYFLKALLIICKDADNIIEQIDWAAMKLLYTGKFKDDRILNLLGVHKIQNQLKDPNQFETLSSIVKGLPQRTYLLDFNSLELQLLQIKVEIKYPALTPMCLQKLVDDMRKMDFYKTDQSCYANLCRSGVCYLFFLLQGKLYKLNVKYNKAFEPLNEKYVLLKTEIEAIKSLQEALGYLAKFLRDKDVWMAKEDRTEYIPLAEMLLRQISETLISRHYKHLAVTAFDLFYKFAKVVDSPLNQMIAAGYIIENIHLISTTSEKEIVTEFQSFIMQKLREVNTMTPDELGSYLFSFLQLTMYTMRYQFNIEHSKKYMQAINKLLTKFDSKKEKYLAARLKYAEVMFELIVYDSETTITPVTFIEDIFHRFKNIRWVSSTDHLTVPGIVLDLLITLYAFTQPRYELRYTSSLCWTVHFAAIRNGYLSLFVKATVLGSSELVLANGKQLQNHMKQLDVLFECQNPAVRTEPEVETTTWNREITSLIHPNNCKCFRCTDKFLNCLNMEVAAIKASAVYFNKEYQKSLDLYQQIYRHWNALSTPTYPGMLMHYSNCLIANGREDESERILNEALDVCNDSAQAQDITVRLLFHAVQGELQIDRQVRSFADEVRPKTVQPKTVQPKTVQPKTVQPKKKVNSKSSVASVATEERRTYPKRSNLRN